MGKFDSAGFLDDFETQTDFLDDVEGSGSGGEVSYQPDFHFRSSEQMDPVDDESVHLIVTSPPYNADWSYGSHDDDLDYATEYMPMLARVFRECYRVLVPGGRMVVNIPSLLRDGSSGGYAIASHIEMMLNDRTRPFNFSYEEEHMKEVAKTQSQTDWRIREWITWYKEFNADGTAPNGSFPRPWGILLNNFHEVALVFQKPGDRDYDDMAEQVIEDSKIDKWTNDLCDDVWTISPENYDFKYADDEEEVPPFPEEFVKRCVALWSYKNDTVLDPFLGRGTTCKVAKEMERESIGFEIRQELEEDIKQYTNANQSGLDQW
jgi:DNA modification methylase